MREPYALLMRCLPDSDTLSNERRFVVRCVFFILPHLDVLLAHGQACTMFCDCCSAWRALRALLSIPDATEALLNLFCCVAVTQVANECRVGVPFFFFGFGFVVSFVAVRCRCIFGSVRCYTGLFCSVCSGSVLFVACRFCFVLLCRLLSGSVLFVTVLLCSLRFVIYVWFLFIAFRFFFHVTLRFRTYVAVRFDPVCCVLWFVSSLVRVSGFVFICDCRLLTAYRVTSDGTETLTMKIQLQEKPPPPRELSQQPS